MTQKTRVTLREILSWYLPDDQVEALAANLLKHGYIQFARRLEKKWR